jgi:hypothetical protein
VRFGHAAFPKAVRRIFVRVAESGSMSFSLAASDRGF